MHRGISWSLYLCYILNCNHIPHILCSFLHVFFHLPSIFPFGKQRTINYTLSIIIFFLLSFSVILLGFVQKCKCFCCRPGIKNKEIDKPANIKILLSVSRVPCKSFSLINKTRLVMLNEAGQCFIHHIFGCGTTYLSHRIKNSDNTFRNIDFCPFCKPKGTEEQCLQRRNINYILNCEYVGQKREKFHSHKNAGAILRFRRNAYTIQTGHCDLNTGQSS